MTVFAAVVAEGGFTKAALALGLSKSYVSKQVAALEADLGVELLVRTTRSVRPTPAGESLFEQCAQLAALASDARRAVESLQTEPVGKLRISVPLSFGRAFLLDPLASFLARHPRLDTTIDMSDHAVDLVRDGYDMAVRVGPVLDPDLVARQVRDSRSVVVAAPSYLKKHGTPETPKDVSQHDCLLYDYLSTRDHWSFGHGRTRQDIPVSGRIRTTSGDLLVRMAVRGLGLAWLPDFLVEKDIAAGRLRVVLDDACEDKRAVSLVFPSRHLPTKVRLLAEHLEATLK